MLARDVMGTKGGAGWLWWCLKEYLRKVRYCVSHVLQTVPLVTSPNTAALAGLTSYTKLNNWREFGVCFSPTVGLVLFRSRVSNCWPRLSKKAPHHLRIFTYTWRSSCLETLDIFFEFCLPFHTRNSGFHIDSILQCPSQTTVALFQVWRSRRLHSRIFFIGNSKNGRPLIFTSYCTLDSDFIVQRNFMIYMGITGTPISVWFFAFPMIIKIAPSEKNSEFLIKKCVSCLFVKRSAVSTCCFPV